MSQLPSDPRAMTAVRQNRAASPTPGDFQNAIAISTMPTVGAVDSVSPVTQSLAQIISGAAGIVSDLGRDAELRRFREGQRAREIAAFNEQQRQDYEKAQKDARELAEKEFLGAGEQTLAVQVQLFQEQAGAAQPTQQMAALLSDVPDAQLEQELVPIVNGYIPEGVPENVRSQLVRKFVPQFATAIAPKRTEVRKNDQLRSADEIGFYNTNPDVSAQEALQSISLLRSKGPFATDAELFTRAYINPAKAAAEVGDVARVTEFYQHAPAEYKNDLLPLIATAQANREKINNDNESAIVENFNSLVQQGAPTSFIRESLDAVRDTGLVRPTRLNALYTEVEQQERSALAKAELQAKQVMTQSLQGEMLTAARTAYASAAMPYDTEARVLRNAVRIGDKDVEVEVRATPQELVEQIQNEEIAGYIQAGRTTTEALQLTAERAVANGYPVYQIARNTESVLAKRAILEFPDDPNYQAVARQFAETLTTYQSLGTSASTVMGLSDDRLALLETASLLMQADVGRDPVRAVTEANRIFTRNPRPLTSDELKTLDEQAGSIATPWFGRNFDNNIQTMRQDITALARVFVRSTGNSEEAIKRASAIIQRDAVRYHGNYVRVPNAQKEMYGYEIGEVLEEQVNQILASHARVNAIDGEEPSASDIEIQYNARNGTFTFHDMRNIGAIVNTGNGPLPPMTRDQIKKFAYDLRVNGWESQQRRNARGNDLTKGFDPETARNSLESIFGPIIQPIRDARQNFGAFTIP